MKRKPPQGKVAKARNGEGLEAWKLLLGRYEAQMHWSKVMLMI